MELSAAVITVRLRSRNPDADPIRAASGRVHMLRHARHGTPGGFTLIEILIVVIILGILAAIVVPHFTNAGKEAKHTALVTIVQNVRSQVALYKLQHNDQLPNIVGNAADNSHWN